MTHAFGVVLMIAGVLAALVPVTLGAILSHQDHGKSSLEDLVSPQQTAK